MTVKAFTLLLQLILLWYQGETTRRWYLAVSKRAVYYLGGVCLLYDLMYLHPHPHHFFFLKNVERHMWLEALECCTRPAKHLHWKTSPLFSFSWATKGQTWWLHNSAVCVRCYKGRQYSSCFFSLTYLETHKKAVPSFRYNPLTDTKHSNGNNGENSLFPWAPNPCFHCIIHILLNKINPKEAWVYFKAVICCLSVNLLLADSNTQTTNASARIHKNLIKEEFWDCFILSGFFRF